MRKKSPEFPPECCGVCKFSEKSEDGYLCWGIPPTAVEMGEGPTYIRGVPIDPEWPACYIFKPRMHG